MRRTNSRRGGIYIAVLGVAMLVTIIGITAVAAARLHARAIGGVADTVTARTCAEAGTDLVADAVQRDSSWRQSRALGAWFQRRAVGTGTVSVVVTDPNDADLGNRPTDEVIVTSIGRSGVATHIQEVTLDVVGTPLPALGMSIHTAGAFNLSSGSTLTVSNGIASTNGTLTNGALLSPATINGRAECLASVIMGNVTGGLTLLAPAKAMPPSSVVTLYRNIATAIPNPGTFERCVIGPGKTPSGATNADGVYVITTSSDVLLRNMRLFGTLVIIAPGREVRIEDSVFMQPARPDYPVLIVDGDLRIRASGASQLSESGQGVNFNPTGAPYLTSEDTVADDSYPSEIQGLVHCRGSLRLENTSRIRGVVLAESSVDVSDSPEITHDPAIFSAPPMGYTSSTRLEIRAGSWRQRTWSDLQADPLFAGLETN